MMEDRLLLDKIDFEKDGLVDGKTYPMKDVDFPTVDPVNPYELTGGRNKRSCCALTGVYAL